MDTMEISVINQNSTPDKNALRLEYDEYAKARQLVVNDLKKRVEKIIAELQSRPIVNERLKSFDSYYRKYLRLKSAGKTAQITDLIGLRIICPYIEDLKNTRKLIKKHFKIVESEIKSHDLFNEFSYESIHLLIRIPKNIIDKRGNLGTDIAEIQVRTILQDAWAEVEHELVYKARSSDAPMKRKLAAVNASLFLADIIFQEVREYQHILAGELNKRRKSFYQKIEEAMDDPFSTEEQQAKKIKPLVFNTGIDLVSSDNVSMDDLLVNALTAHNLERFPDAISMYSQILKLNPNSEVCAIIYNHRGMAYFANSQYGEAVDDFTKVLELDKNSYKAAYYRGVVHSFQNEYSFAINDYTLSLSINPYQSFCLLRRGQAYYHIADYPQALSDCVNSLALEPQNEAAVNFKNLLNDKLRM
jgi:putative GTP pyrophosphokinase